MKFILLDKKYIDDTFIKIPCWISKGTNSIYIMDDKFFKFKNIDCIFFEEDYDFDLIKSFIYVNIIENYEYTQTSYMYINTTLPEVKLAKLLLKSIDHCNKNIKKCDKIVSPTPVVYFLLTLANIIIAFVLIYNLFTYLR